MMPVTLTQCFVCKKPVEIEVPQAFLAAGLTPASVLTVCPDCTAKEHVAGGGLFIELADQPPDAILHLGRIAITSGAVAALADARQHVHDFLECHAKGNWGQIGHVDRTVVTEQEIAQGELATDQTAKLNKIALHTRRGQVMSAYRTRKGADLWVLTTLVNHETVVMLPDEY
jgi:hypothetical protein